MGSPQSYNRRLLEADACQMPDPGAGGIIQVTDQFKTIVTLSSAAVEARSLAPPVRAGQEIEISCSVHAGNITVTLTTLTGLRPNGFNNAATATWTTSTFSAVGQFVKAVAAFSAPNVLRWYFVINAGAIAA